jgi:hypothetical protein
VPALTLGVAPVATAKLGAVELPFAEALVPADPVTLAVAFVETPVMTDGVAVAGAFTGDETVRDGGDTCPHVGGWVASIMSWKLASTVPVASSTATIFHMPGTTKFDDEGTCQV